MTLRRIQLSMLAMVLFTFIFGSGLVTGSDAAVRRGATTKASSAAASNWTFEGCWTQFSVGPCRDVYRDEQGNYWICKGCGTTGNPGPGKCSQISSATLATGFWCS